MKKITVYCGANVGNNPIFAEQAYLLGKTLAQQQIGLVYGGGRVGLMGIIANAVMENGGEVIGVIPQFLSTKEIEHNDITEVIKVDTMHQRKSILFDLSDAFIAMPGGFGTMDELFEMLTWAQLGLHKKPIGLLNIDGFYDAFLTMLTTMVNKQFLRVENQQMRVHSSDIQSLLHQLKNYQAPEVTKWISKEDV